MTKAEKTRQFIIEKTAPVFNVKGYAGTSISDLTEATGLTKGSIYGNFTNKDEVALAAFDYNLSTVKKIVATATEKYTSGKEKLLAFVDVYAEFLKHPFPEGGCPILNTAIECDDTHKELKHKVAEAIEGWKKSIVTLIDQGKREHEFGQDVNAEQVALTIIAVVEGAIMITKATGKLHYRKAIMSSIDQIIKNL